MRVSHIRNNSCWNACTWLAKKPCPEVGCWVTLEDYYKKVGNAKGRIDEDHTPDGEFMICFLTYLQEKNSNTSLYKRSGYDIRNLAAEPTLYKLE